MVSSQSQGTPASSAVACTQSVALLGSLLDAIVANNDKNLSNSKESDGANNGLQIFQLRSTLVHPRIGPLADSYGTISSSLGATRRRSYAL